MLIESRLRGGRHCAGARGLFDDVVAVRGAERAACKENDATCI